MAHRVYSQTITEYIEAVRNYRSLDPSELKWICEKLKEEALRYDDYELVAFAQYHLGAAIFMLGKSDKAIEALNKCLNILKTIADPVLTVRTYNLLGIIYFSKRNIPSAVDCYYTGLSISKENDLFFSAGMISFNIGNLYYDVQNFNSSASYFKDAIGYFSKESNESRSDDYFYMANALLGICYVVTDKLNDAKDIKKLLDSVPESLIPSFTDITRCAVHSFYVLYYNLTKEYEKRDKNIGIILELVKTQEDFISSYDDYLRMCNFLIFIKKFDLFKELFDSVEERAKAYDDLLLSSKLTRLKIKYYEANGIENDDYFKALDDYYNYTVKTMESEKKVIEDVLQIRVNYEKQVRSQKRLENKQEKLKIKSETDALTGIANRYRLTDYSNIVYEQAFHLGKQFAFEIFDIDHFKNYNDTYGHQKGDEVLKTIGKILKKMSNEKIFVSRYGGDEFVIVYYDMTKDEIIKAANDLRNTIINTNIPHCDSPAADRITISQGIFLGKPTKKLKIWDFMYFADLCLYVLKKTCRNSIHISDEPVVSKLSRH